MKVNVCKCIPEIIKSPEKLNIKNYKKYEDDLYKILLDDFVKHEVIFNGKRVYLDFNKVENGKSDTFFHVVCVVIRKYIRILEEWKELDIHEEL